MQRFQQVLCRRISPHTFASRHRGTSCSRSHPQYLFKENNLLLKQHSQNFVGTSWRTLFTSQTLNGSTVSFQLSDIGEGIKEVEVKEWYVEVGETVQQFDNICEVQSDKASVSITSRYDGKIVKRYYNVGDIAQVGDPLVDIELDAEDGAAEEEHTTSPAPEVDVTTETSQASSSTDPVQLQTDLTSDKVLATPAVRHLAKAKNISLSSIQGTGRDGRVLKEDILRHLGETTTVSTQPQPQAPKVVCLTQDTVEPIRGIRKAMFTSMTAALGIPQFGYNDEYNMTKLVELRKHVKKEVQSTIDGKLTYMPFIVKATSMALSKYPLLNSQIDGENLVYKADHNISIAVDTPEGLLVPSIKEVQNLNILEITAELNRLQEAGFKSRLSPNDLAGGTFSLSNIGNIGGTYMRPVIFPPQVAIGALGRIQILPRFDRHDNVTKEHIMCVSWSGDHRVVDGATMARFSNQLKQYLEDPGKMILHLK